MNAERMTEIRETGAKGIPEIHEKGEKGMREIRERVQTKGGKSTKRDAKPKRERKCRKICKDTEQKGKRARNGSRKLPEKSSGF